MNPIKMRPVVYTYFEPVPELPQEDELNLINVWKASWGMNGWQPIVLSPMTIDDSAYYKYYDKLFTYPNVNAKKYEMACMLRWWWLRRAGGGLMVDYDVMNHGFKPDDLILEDSVLNLFRCPCAVYASVKGCSTLIKAIENFDLAKRDYSNGVPYVHDQVVVRAEFDKLGFKEVAVCKEPKEIGSDAAKLVHYTNEWSYKENKRPRWKYVVA